jgi:hypothetical protein
MEDVMTVIMLRVMGVMSIAISRMGMSVLLITLTLVVWFSLDVLNVSSNKNSQSPTYMLRGTLALMPSKWPFRSVQPNQA